MKSEVRNISRTGFAEHRQPTTQFCLSSIISLPYFFVPYFVPRARSARLGPRVPKGPRGPRAPWGPRAFGVEGALCWRSALLKWTNALRTHGFMYSSKLCKTFPNDVFNLAHFSSISRTSGFGGFIHVPSVQTQSRFPLKVTNRKGNPDSGPPSFCCVAPLFK